MRNFLLGSPNRITGMAKALFAEERARTRLDGWFIIRESYMRSDAEFAHLPKEEKAARQLYRAVEELPLELSDHAVFAGTQRDAFARSYALINPAFEVESFAGYCDPTAVYDDIVPNDVFTKERIERVLQYDRESAYVKALSGVYEGVRELTGEVAFFVEQVTGHVIPDMRPVLEVGVDGLIARI
ncbi:MAG: hypothetical protein FWG37_03355, partial [Clostridia bacterium]|nr:hypothetical protein [Clostridia bacterium]